MNKKPPNLRQKAVALQYEPDDAAPKVVAKGSGLVAERIIDKSRETRVPVYKDAQLTEELLRLDVGEHIPPELYEVVAQVLIFISDLDRIEGYKRHASVVSAENSREASRKTTDSGGVYRRR